jgi:hypothetical protein
MLYLLVLLLLLYNWLLLLGVAVNGVLLLAGGACPDI